MESSRNNLWWKGGPEYNAASDKVKQSKQIVRMAVVRIISVVVNISLSDVGSHVRSFARAKIMLSYGLHLPMFTTASLRQAHPRKLVVVTK